MDIFRIKIFYPLKIYENMLTKPQKLFTTHLTLPNICKEVIAPLRLG